MSLIKFGFTAKQIINEDRVKEKDIEVIKNWMFIQTFPKFTNEQIILFLLSCFNDIEYAKSTIKAHFLIRNSVPDVFDNRKLEREELQKQLRAIQYCVLPERTDNGLSIVFARLLDTHHSNFELASAIKLLFMTLDAAIHEHPPKGMVIIYDMSGFGFMHLTKLRLGLVKTYFRYLQEAAPVRLHNVHVLNTTSCVDTIVGLMTAFVKKEVMEKIHFHAVNMDMNTFYEKWVPKRCLPKDLGGDLPSVHVLHEKTVKKLMNMQPYFEAEEQQRRSII